MKLLIVSMLLATTASFAQPSECSPELAGMTPNQSLIHSLRKYDNEMLKCLIKSKIDLNGKGEELSTLIVPLSAAIQLKDLEKVKILLNAGAKTSLNLGDQKWFAINDVLFLKDKIKYSIFSEVLEYMTPPELNSKDSKGYTALARTICYRDDLLAAKTILNYNVRSDHDVRVLDVNSGCGQDGESLLVDAIDHDNSELARDLIKNGADVKLAGPDGRTPIIVASKRGNIPMVKLLSNIVYPTQAERSQIRKNLKAAKDKVFN